MISMCNGLLKLLMTVLAIGASFLLAINFTFNTKVEINLYNVIMMSIIYFIVDTVLMMVLNIMYKGEQDDDSRD